MQTGNLTKATKRALSLASFLGDHETIKRIDDLSESSTKFIEYEINEMKNLLTLMNTNLDVSKEYIERINDEIEARNHDLEAAKIRNKGNEVDFEAEATKIASNLTSNIYKTGFGQVA